MAPPRDDSRRPAPADALGRAVLVATLVLLVRDLPAAWAATAGAPAAARLRGLAAVVSGDLVIALAAAAFLLVSFGILSRVRRKRSPAPWGWVLPAAVVTVILSWAALELTRGRWIASRSWVGIARAGGVLGAAVFGVVVARAAAAWAQRAFLDSPTRRGRTILPVSIAVPVVLTLADMLVFPGQYPVFHRTATALLALAAAWLGFVVAAHGPGLVGRAGLAMSAVAAIGWLTALVPGDHLAARTACARAPGTSRLLLAWRDAALPEGGAIADELIELLRPGRYHDTAVLDSVFPGRQRWNLVIFTVDTVRADRVSAHGFARKTTPVYDALAAGGVLFEAAHAQHPSTHLSMASFLEGRYATGTAWYHEQQDAPLDERPSTFVERFQEGGWSTLAYTSFDPGLTESLGDILPRGFDRFNDRPLSPENPADRTVDRALAGLAETPDDRPFLLWVHLLDPHEPYVRHEAFPFGDSRPDAYLGEIAFADHHMGRVLEALRARPDWERTVVVAHSDHGEELGDRGGWSHNSSIFQEQVHVPLAIRVPGVTPRRIPRNVELVDLAATFTELFGLPPLPGTHGHSLVSCLWPEKASAAPEHTPPDVAFMQLRVPRVGRQDAVIAGRTKLHHDLRTDVFSIHDLEDDPAERVNLALRDADALEALRPVLAACRALAADRLEGGGSAIDPEAELRRRAATGPGSERLAAIERLLLLGRAEPALDAIVALPEDGDAGGLRLVRRHGVRQATSHVSRFLDDDRPDVRAMALLAWSAISDDEGPLRARRETAEGLVALGFRGEGRVAADLDAMLRSRDCHDRVLVASAAACAGREHAAALVRHALLQGLDRDRTSDVLRALRASDVDNALHLYVTALRRGGAPEQDRLLVEAALAQRPVLALPLVRLLLAAPVPRYRVRAQEYLASHGLADREEALLAVEGLRRQMSRVIANGEPIEGIVDRARDAWERAMTSEVVDWGVAFELMRHLLAHDRRALAESALSDLVTSLANRSDPAASLVRRLARAVKAGGEESQPELTLVVASPLDRGSSTWTAWLRCSLAAGRPLPGGDHAAEVRLAWQVTSAAGETRGTVGLPPRGILPGETADLLVALPADLTEKAPFEVTFALVGPGGLAAPPVVVR